jgi:hypothetical protein
VPPSREFKLPRPGRGYYKNSLSQVTSSRYHGALLCSAFERDISVPLTSVAVVIFSTLTNPTGAGPTGTARAGGGGPGATVRHHESAKWGVRTYVEYD